MKRSLIALALAAILPVSAQANNEVAGLTYSYVEAGYANVDFLGEKADGYSVDGSIAFAPHFYGTATYRNASKFGVTLDEATINLGYRTNLSDKADFIAEVGYVNLGVDVDTVGSDNSDGYRLAAGFRGMLAPKFEGNIKAYYTHLSGNGGDGEYGATVGGVFHINDMWGIVASYDSTKLFDEKINTWGVGVRASF